MRQPRILDVLRAVREVAASHPHVRAFWYAPPRRLHPPGAATSAGNAIEVAVEGGAAEDLAGIASDVARSLGVPSVSARPFRGAGEDRQLYRLWTNRRAEEVR
jgi:hypothetical protein